MKAADIFFGALIFALFIYGCWMLYTWIFVCLPEYKRQINELKQIQKDLLDENKRADAIKRLEKYQ